jgi:DNA-directed RNA polymerase specialized sigma subunit
MSSIDDSEQFKIFAKAVEKGISKYGYSDSDDMTAVQCQQVEELARLEVLFRKALIKDCKGDAVYEHFISYVLDEKKNILVARPYFRHRRRYFVNNVSVAIKNRDVKTLQKYHFNYLFINLISKKYKLGKEATQYIKLIQEARQKLVVLNLPLVINRASIFWSRTPKSHLSFLDMIQIGTEGLISGIDKYCGQYTKVWRAVIIGRLLGDLISNYSSTLLHFYPSDSRKLYRANKFKSRHLHGDYAIEDLVEEVSKAIGNETNQDEILGLMAASSIVSADSQMSTEGSEETSIVDSVSRYAAPEEARPDLQVENDEANRLMHNAMGNLTLIDKKLLRLKGIEISLE